MEPVAFVSDKIRGFTKSTQELFGSLVHGRPQPSARRQPNSWPAKGTRVGIDLSECPPSLAKASYTANGSNWLSAIAIPVGAQCRDVAVITSPLTRGRALLIFHHLGHWQCNWLNGEKNQMLLLPWLSLFPYWQCNRVQEQSSRFWVYQLPKLSGECGEHRIGAITIPFSSLVHRKSPETMIEALVPPLGTNSQDNRSTGSVALMLESELDEFTKLGGWIEMKQSNPKHLEWAVTVADDSEDSVGWGIALIDDAAGVSWTRFVVVL
ncbi:hypothetical protein ACFX1Q_016906 [Malus domestica]